MSSFSADRNALFAKNTDNKPKAGGAASAGSKSGGSHGLGSVRGPDSTFTTPAFATSRSSSAFGSPGTAQQQQPKRLNLEKLKEAEEYRIKGQKMLKTSIFGNWKPDFLSAVPYLDKAAALFKASGALEQARDAYVQSAECNEKTATFAAAAMAYKNAALVAKEDQEEEEAAGFLALEADMWVLGGDGGRAADSLCKAAAMVEDQTPEKAVRYSLQATELLFPEGGDPMELAKAPLANDVFAKCLNMCLRLERPAEALQVCGKAAGVLAAQGMSSSLHKMFCTQTILQLYLGDAVAADKTFMEVHLQDSGYLRSSECEAAEALLTAAKAMDSTALHEALQKLPRAYLDNNTVKFARRLNVDRIAGLLGTGDDDEEEEEEEHEDIPRASPLPPPPLAHSSSSGSGHRRSPTPATVAPTSAAAAAASAALFAKSSSSSFCSSSPRASQQQGKRQPAPVAEQDWEGQEEEEEEEEEEGRAAAALGATTGTLMDLSDLQAGLDEAAALNEGEEQEEDLDAAIARAKEAAALSTTTTTAPAPAPALQAGSSSNPFGSPPSTGPPPALAVPFGSIDATISSTAAAVPPTLGDTGGGHNAFSSSSSFSGPASAGDGEGATTTTNDPFAFSPYSPGYTMPSAAPAVPPATKPATAPSQQQQQQTQVAAEEDDGDFDLR